MNSDGYLFDKNLYSYCRNCPTTQKDPDGEATETSFGDGSDGQINTWMPDEMALGGGTWGALMRTMQSATEGLNMAMGQRDMSRFENHHVLSKYRPEFKDITMRYGMSLNSKQNIVALPGHRGRHTDTYHRRMLEWLLIVDATAAGDKKLFDEGFGKICTFVQDHPGLPYAK